MIRRQSRRTWGQVLGEAAGVDQDVGLEGGVKVVICAEEGERMSFECDRLEFIRGGGWAVGASFLRCFTCCRAGCRASTPAPL